MEIIVKNYRNLKEVRTMDETEWMGVCLMINGFFHIPWIIITWINDYKILSVIYILLGIFFAMWGFNILTSSQTSGGKN